MIPLGITGWSGSGKTTLITALIPILRARGLTVSTIKHAHHAVPLDKPGKDSFRHTEAGATETILATNAGFALIAPHGETPLDVLLTRLAPVDLVLVEGFKTALIPKLEVHRPALGKPPLWPDTTVLAVASDAPLPACAAPVLPLGQPDEIADFLIRILGLNSIRL